MALLIAQQDGPRIVRAVEHAEQATVATGQGVEAGKASPLLVQRFELTSSLEKSGTAEAVLVIYENDAYVTKEGATFAVCDSDGTYAGNIGARGLCFKMHDRREWEVRDITCDS